MPSCPKTSACHATISCSKSIRRKQFCANLGSLNGTRVNGVRYGGRKRAGPAANAPPMRVSESA